MAAQGKLCCPLHISTLAVVPLSLFLLLVVATPGALAASACTSDRDCTSATYDTCLASTGQTTGSCCSLTVPVGTSSCTASSTKCPSGTSCVITNNSTGAGACLASCSAAASSSCPSSQACISFSSGLHLCLVSTCPGTPAPSTAVTTRSPSTAAPTPSASGSSCSSILDCVGLSSATNIYWCFPQTDGSGKCCQSLLADFAEATNCISNADCASGRRCLNPSTTGGVCIVPCTTTADCVAGGSCVDNTQCLHPQQSCGSRTETAPPSATSTPVTSRPSTSSPSTGTPTGTPTSSTTAPTPTVTSGGGDGGRSNTGVIVGATVGGLACVALIAVGVVFVFFMMKKKGEEQGGAGAEKFPPGPPPPPMATPVPPMAMPVTSQPSAWYPQAGIPGASGPIPVAMPVPIAGPPPPEPSPAMSIKSVGPPSWQSGQ